MTNRAVLLALLTQTLLPSGGSANFTLESLADDIDTIYLPSFDKVHSSHAEKYCQACGHVERIYKLKFRRSLIPALAILSEVGGSMTAGEIADRMDHRNGRAATSTRRYFC